MLDWNGKYREKLWFTLPAKELAQHGIVIGGSGTGKTVTLLRIAYLAAKVYKWKVFFIDAKGDRPTATKFVATMRQAGLERIAIFPAQPYNGFCGDGNGLLNRLMAVEDYSEQYYKVVAKRVLDIVCKRLGEPPRTSLDLLERIEAVDLARYHLDKLRSDTLGGVEMRYRAFFDTLDGKLDGTWSYDTVDAGYILLDGLALKEEATALGRYLIEDYASYAANRKHTDEQNLLIVDEFSALSTGTDAANLFERLRSFNAAVIVSSQGYDGLGEGAERMLDAAKFIVVHRTPKPEPFTLRAGRKQEVTQSHRVEDEFTSGSSTVRLEEQAAINANEPRQLNTGEAIIISKGRWRKVKIAPAPVDVQAEDLAETWIQTLYRENRAAAPVQPNTHSQEAQGEPDILFDEVSTTVVDSTLHTSDTSPLTMNADATYQENSAFSERL